MNRPGGVFVFDGVDGGDVAGMNERVAACYARAADRCLVVLDEVISWPPRFEPDRDEALRRAAAECRWHRAALLVHSAAVVSQTEQSVLDLAGIPVWSVDARLPFPV